jgi:general stress protein 26
MEKSLQNEEALKKFKKLVQEINVCMFITNHETEHEHTRPMATIDVEDDGTLWFFTDVRSIKVEEVTTDRLVHLTYAHPGKESYLDVKGASSIVTDRDLMRAKWSPVVRAYFPNGVDDPNLALMKVQPQSVYYWESESGKMVQFFKMATAAVTGKPNIAEGAEGKLTM